jgi:hypothetical protein
MKCSENECTPQGTRIYRGEVTSRYKKYCPAILVGLGGISDGLVTTRDRHNSHLPDQLRLRDLQIRRSLEAPFKYPLF